MAQPSVAPPSLNKCAACYGQYPDRIFIDYRAAIEGRLLDPSKPRGGHIDWVVICEKCLRDGVALLPKEKGRTDALAQRVRDLEAQLAETQEYAAKVEDALQGRPASMAPKTRQAAKGQPRRNRYEQAAA
jgi:hypothetical protein